MIMMQIKYYNGPGKKFDLFIEFKDTNDPEYDYDRGTARFKKKRNKLRLELDLYCSDDEIDEMVEVINQTYLEKIPKKQKFSIIANGISDFEVAQRLKQVLPPGTIREISGYHFYSCIKEEKMGDLTKIVYKKQTQTGFDYRLELQLNQQCIAHMILANGGKYSPIGTIAIVKSWVEEEFRGKGYGKILYQLFCEIYNQEKFLRRKPIARNFESPISLYLAKWCLEKKLLPAHSWDDQFITYYRYSTNKEINNSQKAV
jgi:hypothetical protein